MDNFIHNWMEDVGAQSMMLEDEITEKYIELQQKIKNKSKEGNTNDILFHFFNVISHDCTTLDVRNDFDENYVHYIYKAKETTKAYIYTVDTKETIITITKYGKVDSYGKRDNLYFVYSFSIKDAYDEEITLTKKIKNLGQHNKFIDKSIELLNATKKYCKYSDDLDKCHLDSIVF